MARFNQASAGSTKTENLAGGEAYKQPPELELVSILLTSMVQDQYYSSAEDGIQRLSDVIKQVKDKQFVAKAAVYSRNEFGLRSITHVTAGELAKQVKGEDWTKDFYSSVVRRPDDITEILSYYASRYGKRPIPNSLKRGLAKAFDKFDEYQLAKYRGDNKEISLLDAVNLVRPVPTKKNKVALKKLVGDELRSTETWEAKQSAAGDDDEAKAKNWSGLIKERKIGYFALLRNLRNILEQAPEVADDAAELLQDEKLIKKSLVLPFRFLTAYDQLQQVDGSSKILGAISGALDISFSNVPKLDGKTLVVVDHSGSMGSGYDSDFVKGALFGIAMAKANDADFMHFGNESEYLSFNPADSTLTLVDYLDNLNKGWDESGKGYVGHGTNFPSIFHEANKKYDRIVIFSDMQGWMGGSTPDSSVGDYKKRHGANPHIYSIDLAGYGDMQFPENQVYALAGFSEKIFDLMKVLETDKKALINTIKEVKLNAYQE